MSDFPYLATHTHFSRAGGPASPGDWCLRARDLGYGVLFLVDRSPLAGWQASYRAAQGTGLRIIYGMEASLLFAPTGARRGAQGEGVRQEAWLVAQGEAGAASLARLSSLAYAGWPSAESPLTIEALGQHAAGLAVVLLGSDEAGAPSPVMETERKHAAAWLEPLRSLFGPNLYMGLAHSGRPGDDAIARIVAERAAALEVTLAATPCARYLHPDDAPAYEALRRARSHAGWPRGTAISEGTSPVASDRNGYDYARRAAEVQALYARWPQAIEGAATIASQAATGDWLFSPQVGRPGLDVLTVLAEQRLEARLGGKDLPSELQARLRSELENLRAWGDAAGLSALAELAMRAAGSMPLGAPRGLENLPLAAYALGLSAQMPPDLEAAPPEQAQAADTIDVRPLPCLPVPQRGREVLSQALASDYGRARVALATCPLDMTPTAALGAAARVLGAPSDAVRTLLLAVASEGWGALKQAAASEGTQLARLASIALSLKGAPLSFVPDEQTLLVAPRQAMADMDLAALTPLLRREGGSASSVSLTFSPWSAGALHALGYPVVALPATRALDAAHSALELARRYPAQGFAPTFESAFASASDLTALIKANHPAAYLASALWDAWRYGGPGALASIAEEARKLGIKIEPPHINFSQAEPSLQRDGEGWSVLWGLATIPGWDAERADALLRARPATGFMSMAALAEAAYAAEMGEPELKALIMSGGCDTLGDRPRDRDAMLTSLPAMLEWAASRATQHASHAAQYDLFSAPSLEPPAEADLVEANAQASFDPAGVADLSPRERYLRRQWEEEHLGVGLTPAPEMAALLQAIEKSGGLRARLTWSDGIDTSKVGSSLYMVGILSSISLVGGQDGDPMAVGVLEDPHGALELVAFPPNYKRNAALWSENSAVAVTARVMAHPEGDLYLLCEQMSAFSIGAGNESFSITIKSRGRAAKGAASSQAPIPATAASAPAPAPPAPSTANVNSAQPAPVEAPTSTLPAVPAYSLIISIPDADEDQPVIDKVIGLKRLLAEYPGPDKVTLRVPYLKGLWTTAGLPWGIRFTHQLEARLRRLLGDDALAVIKLEGAF